MAQTRPEAEQEIRIGKVSDYIQYIKGKPHTAIADDVVKAERAELMLRLSPENTLENSFNWDNVFVDYKLRDLGDNDKAEIIAALLTNDLQKLSEQLGGILGTYDDTEAMERITTFAGTDSGAWANPVCSKLIKTLLNANANEEDGHLHESKPLPPDRVNQ